MWCGEMTSGYHICGCGEMRPTHNDNNDRDDYLGTMDVM